MDSSAISVESHVKYFTLIMVRHGISCANIDTDLVRKQSSKDPDLTRWGLYHAMRLSIPFQEALRRDGYSEYPVGASVLMRAQQTAFFMTHTPDSYTFPGGMTNAPCRSIHIMPFASEVVTQGDFDLVREVVSSFQLDNQPQSIAEQSVAYNNLCSPFIVPCLNYDFVTSKTNTIDYFPDAIVPNYTRMKYTLERLAKHAPFDKGMILFSHGKFIRHIYDTIKKTTPTIKTPTPKHIENCAATLFKFAIGLDGVFRPVSITPYDYTGTGTTVPKEEEKSEEHWRPDTCLTPRLQKGAAIYELDKETRCRVFDQLRILAMGGNSSSSSSYTASANSNLPPTRANQIISGYDSFLIDFANSLTPPTSKPSSGLFSSLFGSASAAAKDTLPECLSSIKGPLLRALLVRDHVKPIPETPLETAIDTIKDKFDTEELRTRLQSIMTLSKPKESIYIDAMSQVIQKIYEIKDCSTSIKELATKYQSIYKNSLIYNDIGSAELVAVRRRKSRRTNVRRRRQTRRRILG
jgi:broad specificity phosphatase PhoE